MRLGVALRVSSWASRSTTRTISRPAEARIAVWTTDHDPAATPSTDSTRSPGRMPAAAAGAAGSPGPHSTSAGASAGTTHSDTVWMVVVVCRVPKPMAMIASSTVARTRFITGPPSITTSFCQTFRL